MNAFDYFFEKSSSLNKYFLVGKEEITFRELHSDCINLANWLREKVGQNKNILLLSANNLFFTKTYLSVIKSGNICIPLDPGIEFENFRFIEKCSVIIVLNRRVKIQKKIAKKYAIWHFYNFEK